MMLNCSPAVLIARRLASTVAKSLKEERVAVVLGSTDGIGYCMAKKLAEEGSKVVLSSRKSENVERAVDQLRGECEGVSVEGVVCHAGDPDQRKNLISQTVGRFGRLDYLVCNAGVNPALRGTLETSESEWDKIFDINVKAAALLVKEAHPHLRASGAGSVVFVSTAGVYSPSFIGAYTTCKAALIGLTKVLSEELAPDKIRVNCIAPGLIKTKFGQLFWDTSNIEYMPTHPCYRVGEPDECAGVVAFLCSDEASYITGETVPVSGLWNTRI